MKAKNQERMAQLQRIKHMYKKLQKKKEALKKAALEKAQEEALA
jgi:dTMP kinase